MDTHNITRLINRWKKGDKEVINDLMPLIYNQLHEIARYSQGVRLGDVTMRPTALVHEAFIKIQNNNQEVLDRKHFFAAAALTMRRIMIDFARNKKRAKRGGDQTKVQFDDNNSFRQNNESTDIIDLNDALNLLEKNDKRKAQIIELHYFGGLSYDEIADILSISLATVGRELKFAKAWLAKELTGKEK